MMTTTLKIARRLRNAVIGALFVASLVIIVAVAMAPVTGRYRLVTVLTGSMRPYMAPGAVAIETPTSARDLQSGDVVSFQPPDGSNAIVTHRVLSVERGEGGVVIETKGDASNAADPWRAVLGSGPVWKVRFVIPGVGYAVVLLRQAQTLRALAIGLPLLLVAGFLFDLWRPRASQDKVQADVAPT